MGIARKRKRMNPRKDAAMDKTTHFTVTISRQLGAGGVYIGQRLAKKRDVVYADREIIREAARKLSVLEDAVESREEKIDSFWKALLRPYAAGMADAYVPPKERVPTTRELFEAEAQIIKRIAGESSSVIIGRCGSYILRDHPMVISVFLHADVAFRKKRIAEFYAISESTAEKTIARSDKERALYHRTFTGVDWADATRYDLALDTGKIGFEKSCDIILKYIDTRRFGI
jgi:cytidylate kinase